MSELRPFALLRTGDQWIRCSFEQTFLDLDAGIVELAWTTATANSNEAAPPVAAGLAFDRECRLYHSVPAEGRIERTLWRAANPLGPVADQPAAVDIFAHAEQESIGEFTAVDPATPLQQPRGLAVDVNDRLFIAETGGDRILVYDLWSDRLIRRLSLPGARPTDLAAHGHDVYAVLSGTGKIVRLKARSGPEPFDLPAGCTAPSRIAVSPGGEIAILEKAATPAGRVWFTGKGFASLAAPLATDIEWESDTVIIVARQPGADFLRFEVAAGKVVQLSSLRARAYDGLGIVATPGCGTPRRVGYWTANGFRIAVAARAIFERLGRVTTFRLDSGAYQTVWGRLFVDACIPEGSELRVHYIVLDEVEDEEAILRVPPANVQQVTIRRPDLSPPMPPAIAAPGPADIEQSLHLRESGRELPWTGPLPGDRFDTFEAPINAPPGRFLWITLELRGNTRVSPKVRAIRAEHPAHDYLRRLPRTFSREPRAASFLLRYLAMFEGFLGETEARGADRDLLLDPRSTPDECLAWLASFVGMTLDERWAHAPSSQGGSSVDARRDMVREAVWLFRFRGTLPGLRRFIEIYTGTPVIIIEHYRLRGIGAAILGDDSPAFSSSVVGAGFRVGGAIGKEEATPLAGNVEDAFRTHAHRFTVLIPAALTEEELDVVRHIIEVHRPAHTIFDLCTAGAGMRVGRGLMLALSSIIGPTGTFSTFQIGGSTLGRGAILGKPDEGGHVGNSRIGRDSTVG